MNAGRVGYFGSVECAVGYFIDIWYEPQSFYQSLADFLVSLMDLTAPKVRPGMEQIVIFDPVGMVHHWNNSVLGTQSNSGIEAIPAVVGTVGSARPCAGAEKLVLNLRICKACCIPHNSLFVTTWIEQTRSCLHRRYLMQVGEPGTHIVMMIAMIAQGLTLGSVLVVPGLE